MQWEFTLVIKRTKECNGNEFGPKRKFVRVSKSDPRIFRFLSVGVKTFDYLCGADEPASVGKNSLETLLRTDSSGIDLLHDVQETSPVLPRILPTIIDRKTGEVKSSENEAPRDVSF